MVANDLNKRIYYCILPVIPLHTNMFTYTQPICHYNLESPESNPHIPNIHLILFISYILFLVAEQPSMRTICGVMLTAFPRLIRKFSICLKCEYKIKTTSINKKKNITLSNITKNQPTNYSTWCTTPKCQRGSDRSDDNCNVLATTTN